MFDGNFRILSAIHEQSPLTKVLIEPILKIKVLETKE
jgi:hypothetical protein